MLPHAMHHRFQRCLNIIHVLCRFVAIIPPGHTFATLSLQSHVDPKTLSEALGHATVAFTLDVYGHSNEDMKQQAADQLEQLICQY